MGYICGVDRAEQVLFPEAIDDYVARENPVRFLDAFVDSLDLAALGFGRTTPAHTGRPAYAPADLLKLYLYGYLNKVRSSRRLEAETLRNVEVMWLLRKLQPDFKTIADFRKDNAEALRRVCREFTLLCKSLDLFSGELIGIDGSKFRAVNSKDRSFSAKELKEKLEQIDRRIEEYLQRLEEADTAEEGQERPSAEALREKIAQLTERKERYEGYQQQMQQADQEQVTLTDPESRRMKVKGGGTEVCYNAQIAVDSKHKLIVAEDVTNEVTDQNQLAAMAIAAKQVLEVEQMEAVADQGYYDGAEVKQCLEEQIASYVPKPHTSANEKRGLYTKEQFRYDRESDVYVCPGEQRLEFGFQTVEKGRAIRYYSTPACKTCPLRAKCTQNKRGRRITRWVDEHLLEEMAERLKQKPEVMQQRKQLCEHPFGTMKRGMEASYFLTKGLRKVRAEFSLTVLAYNLKRALNLVGVEGLLAALKPPGSRPLPATRYSNRGSSGCPEATAKVLRCVSAAYAALTVHPQLRAA
jgi:transposase